MSSRRTPRNRRQVESQSNSCPRCGHGNPADAAFCANCGGPLRDDATLPLSRGEIGEALREDAPRTVLPQDEAALVVVRGPNAGSYLPLDKDGVTVGRSPESDIFLDDVTVSRRHAEIRRKGVRFFIHDLGSLNGTYVHRIRIDSTQLADGDEVQIGRYKLVFRAGGRR